MINRSHYLIIALCVAAPLVVAGCSDSMGETANANSTISNTDSSAGATRHPSTPGASERCERCGVVIAVNKITKDGDESTAAGTIIGAVVGGVVGHQFGGGSGKTVATIAGAAGGAVAGRAIEDNIDDKTLYRVSARLNDGRTVTVRYKNKPSFTEGQEVKLVNQEFVLK